MKKSHGIIFITALLAVAVSFDLGSKHSWLGQAMEKGRASLASEKKSPESSAGKAEVAPDKLRAEAREIWARMGRLDFSALKKRYAQFFAETDPLKRYEILRAMGVTLSREKFEQVLKIPMPLYPGFEKPTLFRSLFIAWLDESPREALAWMQFLDHRDSSAEDSFFFDHLMLELCLCRSLKEMQREPEVWEAFLSECPFPDLQMMAQALLREPSEPGSLWLMDNRDLYNLSVVYVKNASEVGDFDAAWNNLVRCPDEGEMMSLAIFLSDHLTDDFLRQLAAKAGPQHKSISNVYLALVGDDAAQYEEAVSSIFYLGEFYSADKALQRLYPEWLKREGLDKVFEQAVKDNLNTNWDRFMQAAVKGTSINEEYIVRQLGDSVPHSFIDSLIVELYEAQYGKDYRSSLDRILHSSGIEDQVAASRKVLGRWSAMAPAEAAKWFQSLPSPGEFPELAAEIMRPWLNADGDNAVAFIMEEGLGSNSDIRQSLYMALNHDKISPPMMNQLMRSLRDEPGYDEFLFFRASYLLTEDPAKGVQFLQQHAPGPWQTFVVDQVNAWMAAGYKRTAYLMPYLDSLDFSSVPAEKMKIFNEGRAKINATQTPTKPEGNPLRDLDPFGDM